MGSLPLNLSDELYPAAYRMESATASRALLLKAKHIVHVVEAGLVRRENPDG